MKLIPVENNSYLARDPNSSAVLNVDKENLIRHRRRRSMLADKENNINMLNERIIKLEQMLSELINKNEQS